VAKWPPRGIVEQQRFRDDREAITANCKLFDEACSGVTWALAREATPDEATESVLVPGCWVIRTREYLDLPPLEIAYTFDDKQVYLEGARVAEVEDEDDSS
jgi:hypothetical protein